MEDVLGGRTDPERFDAFLADWAAILARRVDEAVAAFAAVDGVRGLVLAGGVGRGEPWPLSDIDLLPIYDDGRVEPARVEVERRRVGLLSRWVDEGWWTGLDVGRLAFDHGEVVRTVGRDGPPVAEVLGDDRWYHGLDKGYRGRAVADPSGVAASLAGWLTDHRFNPTVVRFRLARARRETADAQRRVHEYRRGGDPWAATREVRAAVKWVQAWWLETWGERDASLGRLGTRFERLARARGRPDLADELNALGAWTTGRLSGG